MRETFAMGGVSAPKGIAVSIIFSLLVGATACGGMKPPQARLTSAESAVSAAEVGGAPDLPKGKLHLKYARDQITEARKLMDEKENERADLLLRRAEVDAQYALALARHEEVRKEAEEILETIDELMGAAK